MKINEYRTAFDKLEPDNGMEERIFIKVVKKRRVNTSFICACGAIAACICIALLVAPLFKQNSDITAYNDPDTAVEATAYTFLPTAGKVVLTGSDFAPAEELAIVTGAHPGEVKISFGLSGALEDPENSGALFYAAVSVYHTLGQDFKYKGKTFEEWLEEPAIEEYNEAYQTWHDEIYVPYDAEMTAAEERGEERAQGWWKHDKFELFNNYWNETRPEDVKAAYRVARENASAAKAAYDGWIASDEYKQLENEIFESERSRLAGLGYELTVLAGKLTGNLTKQQIEDFPALGKYGYMIGWADEGEALAG